MKPAMNPATLRAVLKVASAMLLMGVAVIAKFEAGEITNAQTLMAAMLAAAAGSFGLAAKAPGDVREEPAASEDS